MIHHALSFFFFFIFHYLLRAIAISPVCTKQTTVASKSAIGTTIERSIVASVVGV
tara:strand:- start:1960 stop:2124 length:165 start_codon:yes stop_codon:yes gene_type:complete